MQYESSLAQIIKLSLRNTTVILYEVTAGILHLCHYMTNWQVGHDVRDVLHQHCLVVTYKLTCTSHHGAVADPGFLWGGCGGGLGAELPAAVWRHSSQRGTGAVPGGGSGGKAPRKAEHFLWYYKQFNLKFGVWRLNIIMNSLVGGPEAEHFLWYYKQFNLKFGGCLRHECVTSFELANDTVNKQKELTLIRKLSLSLLVSV